MYIEDGEAMRIVEYFGDRLTRKGGRRRFSNCNFSTLLSQAKGPQSQKRIAGFSRRQAMAEPCAYLRKGKRQRITVR